MSRRCLGCGDPLDGDREFCSDACEAEVREDISSADWQRKFLADNRFDAAGVPPVLCEPWRDDICPEAPDLRDRAEKYVAGFSKWKVGLFFSGNAGVGKSRMAAQIVRLACDAGISCRWYSAPSLFVRLRATMHPRSGETETEILHEMVKPQLIVLDDLGAERCSEWVIERLYLILNERMEHLKKCLITSNMSLQELKAYWSTDPACAPMAERLISRIAGTCRVVSRFGQRDLRQEER